MQQPETKKQKSPTQKPRTARNHRMQQPKTRCSNSEQHRTATQKTKTEQPKKEKNPEYQPRKHLLINPENTNPQQKIFHQRTNLEKTENELRDKPNQKTQKTDL